MNIYVVKNDLGNPQVIWGSWRKARQKAVDGIVRTIPYEKLDDLRAGRVKLSELKIFSFTMK